MKTLIVLILIVAAIKTNTQSIRIEQHPVIQDIVSMVSLSGHKVNIELVDAIYKASVKYQVKALDLTAIAIVESGFGRYMFRKNKNGTTDVGAFQINSIHSAYCGMSLKPHRLNAECAAKLLAMHKKAAPTDYLGRYHSKTLKYKKAYLTKINKIMSLYETKVTSNE